MYRVNVGMTKPGETIKVVFKDGRRFTHVADNFGTRWFCGDLIRKAWVNGKLRVNL